MKKKLSLVLSLLMVCGLVGCNKDTKDLTDSSTCTDVTNYVGDTYTPAEMKTIISTLEDNGITKGCYKVAGKAKEVEYDFAYKTFNVVLEGNEKFELYGCNLASGIATPGPGSEIECVGFGQKYVKDGVTTYELAYVNKKADHPIISKVVGGTPVATTDPDVTLEPVGEQQDVAVSFAKSTISTYRTEASDSIQKWVFGDLSFINEKDKSTNNVPYDKYPDDSYAQIRCYKNSKITISYSEPIKSILWTGFETAGQYASKYVLSIHTTIEGATLTKNGLDTLIVLDEPKSSVTFNLNFERAGLQHLKIYCE